MKIQIYTNFQLIQAKSLTVKRVFTPQSFRYINLDRTIIVAQFALPFRTASPGSANKNRQVLVIITGKHHQRIRILVVSFHLSNILFSTLSKRKDQSTVPLIVTDKISTAAYRVLPAIRELAYYVTLVPTRTAIENYRGVS